MYLPAQNNMYYLFRNM